MVDDSGVGAFSEKSGNENVVGGGSSKTVESCRAVRIGISMS